MIGLFLPFCMLGWSRIGDCPEEPEKDAWYYVAGVLMVLIAIVSAVLLLCVALAILWTMLDLWAMPGRPLRNP